MTDTTEQQPDLFDIDPSSETEEDLEPSSPDRSSQAVVTGTDWTAETLLSQLERGNIELNPRFQRRDAWTDQRKSRFIESLVLGLPMPQLVLAERAEQRGSYVVIDGKQRLLALRRFAAEGGGEFDPLALSGLDVRGELNGMTFEQMRASSEFREDVTAFENQTIRTMVVRAWPDEDFLFRVFLRLNTGSVPLSPQELRQALHPGPFVDFADDRSADSTEIRAALNLDRPDFRMRDVELLIRYFAFARFIGDYDGNLKRFLDLTCSRLNQAWEDNRESIKKEADECDAAIAAARTIFAPDAFRRFSDSGFEGRFNRAIFDVIVFYFRLPRVRKGALERGSDVVEAFKKLSVEDRAFADAITQTTKSIASTHTRLEAWGRVLKDLLDVEVNVPVLRENRIWLD